MSLKTYIIHLTSEKWFSLSEIQFWISIQKKIQFWTGEMAFEQVLVNVPKNLHHTFNKSKAEFNKWNSVLNRWNDYFNELWLMSLKNMHHTNYHLFKWSFYLFRQELALFRWLFNFLRFHICVFYINCHLFK